MKVEMSEAALGARLEEYSQIWLLCMTLKNSKVIARPETKGDTTEKPLGPIESPPQTVTSRDRSPRAQTKSLPQK